MSQKLHNACLEVFDELVGFGGFTLGLIRSLLEPSGFDDFGGGLVFHHLYLLLGLGQLCLGYHQLSMFLMLE